MIGRDMLYTRSPEDIVEESLMHSKFENFEYKARNSLPERTKQVYDLNELGLRQVEVARQLGISQPTVHREIQRAKEILKSSYEQWRAADDV